MYGISSKNGVYLVVLCNINSKYRSNRQTTLEKQFYLNITTIDSAKRAVHIKVGNWASETNKGSSTMLPLSNTNAVTLLVTPLTHSRYLC